MKNIKKCFVLLLTAVILFGTSGFVFAEDFDYRSFENIGIYVVEANTGRVLIDKNSDERYAPASITKILSVLTALDYMRPTDRVDVTEEILAMVQSNSSLAELKDGERLTFSQVIDAMLIPSGNDASYALAAACGRFILKDDQAGTKEAVEAFIDAMNVKAKSLGMTNSVFLNPDGYPADGMYSTAKDMTLLGIAARSRKEITEAAAKTSVSCETNKTTHKWYSSNMLLHKTNKSFGSQQGGNNPLYDSRNKGLKTGNAGDSKGRSLLFLSDEDGMEIVGAVMHVLPSSKETIWSASDKASDYAFGGFSVVSLIDGSNREAVFTVSNRGMFEFKTLTLCAKDQAVSCIEKEYLGNITLAVIPNEEYASMNMKGKLSLKKSISVGDEAATGVFYHNGEIVAEVVFVATSNYRKIGIIDFAVYTVLVLCAAALLMRQYLKSKSRYRRRKK